MHLEIRWRAMLMTDVRRGFHVLSEKDYLPATLSPAGLDAAAAGRASSALVYQKTARGKNYHHRELSSDALDELRPGAGLLHAEDRAEIYAARFEHSSRTAC